jgi:hypothetical protein
LLKNFPMSAARRGRANLPNYTSGQWPRVNANWAGPAQPLKMPEKVGKVAGQGMSIRRLSRRPHAAAVTAAGIRPRRRTPAPVRRRCWRRRCKGRP